MFIINDNMAVKKLVSFLLEQPIVMLEESNGKYLC